MPKLRARSWTAALAAILVAPVALTGCADSSSSAAPDAPALSDVTFSAGTLDPAPFAPDTTYYFLTLPFGTTTFTVTPTAAEPDATAIAISQDGGTPAPLASGATSSDLAAPAIGARSVVVLTLSASGRPSRTYGFLVTQTVNRNATLSSLEVSAGTLTPAFASATTSYSVTVPNGTAAFTVTPTAAGEGAAITVAQDAGAAVPVASGTASAPLAVPSPGTSSTVRVRVTAQDSTTAATYSITVRQLANDDATLSSLVDSAGALTGFAPGTFTYAFRVPFQSGAFTVTPTANSAQVQSIRVNGALVASGAASPPLALTEGAATQVDVVVTAQDGTTTRTYTLNVTEGPQAGLVTLRDVPVGPSPLAGVPANALLPANDAGDVPVDTILRIGFDDPPALGTTGTIRIYRVGTATPVDTINIADPYAIYDGTSSRLTTNQTSTKVNVLGGLASGISQVRIVNYVPIAVSGNTAVIFPHNNKLAYGGQYYVTIDNGLLAGTRNGATFTGFAAPATPGTPDPNAWQFTVKASGPTSFPYQVAWDGSADFATVQGAIDAVPNGSTASTNVIQIAPGVYQELLWIRSKTVTLRGTDSVATVIQYDNCDGFNPGVGGGQAPGAGGTFPTGNLTGGGRAVLLTGSATGIVLDRITLKNIHGQGSQTIPTLPTPTTLPSATAVTFTNYNSAVTQAETIYFNVSFGTPTATTPPAEPGTLVARGSNFVSAQDTLQIKGWAWFYDCFVTGDVDFVWGAANTVLFERSELRSRFNAAGASIVQSRANMNYALGTSPVPSTTDTTYAGFVFLRCALTKEPGADFTAYLARSPGTATTSTVGSGATTYTVYTRYDLVSFVECSMESHIAAVGWSVGGPNPSGANLVSTPVVGWREYRSFAPDGRWVNTAGRLANPVSASLGGSVQLSDADAQTFFRDRATIFGGATNGTYTIIGYPGGWNPQP
jgi:pectin methylesterase-like acyl-CoA thioesterase